MMKYLAAKNVAKEKNDTVKVVKKTVKKKEEKKKEEEIIEDPNKAYAFINGEKVVSSFYSGVSSFPEIEGNDEKIYYAEISLKNNKRAHVVIIGTLENNWAQGRLTYYKSIKKASLKKEVAGSWLPLYDVGVYTLEDLEKQPKMRIK